MASTCLCGGSAPSGCGVVANGLAAVVSSGAAGPSELVQGSLEMSQWCLTGKNSAEDSQNVPLWCPADQEHPHCSLAEVLLVTGG